MSEQILVFPAENLDGFDFANKIILMNDAKFPALLGKTAFADNLSFVDRKPAETNPSLKQVIPYCILIKSDKIFAYRRTSKGGEDRLHAKWSIGVGGHCNPIDSNQTSLFHGCLVRELSEEVGITDFSKIFYNFFGVIYDDSNEVGKVHCGFVCLVHVPSDIELHCADEALSHGDFENVDILKKNLDSFENWSQIVINNIPLLQKLGFIKQDD